jgi:hypothetical protein
VSPDPNDSLFQLVLNEVKAVRADMNAGNTALRAEFNARIDKLVSTEAFTAEQRRVDERFADLGSDLVAEREARLSAEKDADERHSRLVNFMRALGGAVGAVALAVFVFVLPHLRWGS